MIRHGETDWNRRRALQGRLNTPLNETGIAQAQDAHAKLKTLKIEIDLVYASPLQRAMTTASIVSGRAPVEITTDERLLEIAFGEWEGREMSAIGAPLTPFFKDPDAYVPPQGGEAYASLLRRTADFLHMVRTKHVGKRILVVSHGAATAALLIQARGLPLSELWATPVRNCQLFQLTADSGVWSPELSLL